MMQYLLPPELWPIYVPGCKRLQVDPVDLLAVSANESGCNPAAWNAGGKAAGMWQMTPVAAPGMGWDPHDTHSFCNLSAVEQWPHWERYFAPHRGQLVSRAACYVCTGWPAGLSIAGNPDALLCSKDGRTDIPVPHEYAHLGKWPEAEVQSWYHGNLGFDRGHTGEIYVRDLTDAINRSTLALGGVWADYVAAIRAEEAKTPSAVLDVTDAGNDAPIFTAPDPLVTT